MPRDDEYLFYGHDGAESCDRFVASIMQYAFLTGNQRNYSWMADAAATFLRGEAMWWWMGLDDEVQMDWKRLRVALAERYSSNNKPASSSASGISTPAAAPRALSLSPTKAWSVIDRELNTVPSGVDDAGSSAASAIEGVFSSRSETSLVTASGPPVPVSTLQPAGRVLISEWVPRWGRIKASPSSSASEDAWLQEARQRRAVYDKAGPDSLNSVHWLLVEQGEDLPDAAIQTGLEEGIRAVFSARIWHERGLHPGKAVAGPTAPGIYISFDGGEICLGKPYEVLVGDVSAIRWINNPSTPEGAGSAPPIQMKAFHAVEGGHEPNGSPLLLTQAYRENGGWQIGKVGKGWSSCEVSLYGETLLVKNFRILVWDA